MVIGTRKGAQCNSRACGAKDMVDGQKDGGEACIGAVQRHGDLRIGGVHKTPHGVGPRHHVEITGDDDGAIKAVKNGDQGIDLIGLAERPWPVQMNGHNPQRAIRAGNLHGGKAAFTDGRGIGGRQAGRDGRAANAAPRAMQLVGQDIGKGGHERQIAGQNLLQGQNCGCRGTDIGGQGRKIRVQEQHVLLIQQRALPR